MSIVFDVAVTVVMVSCQGVKMLLLMLKNRRCTFLKELISIFSSGGEVYMTNEAFDKVNEIWWKLKGKNFLRIRNCAAGTLRQLDIQLLKRECQCLFSLTRQQRQREFATTVKDITFKTARN